MHSAITSSRLSFNAGGGDGDVGGEATDKGGDETGGIVDGPGPGDIASGGDGKAEGGGDGDRDSGDGDGDIVSGGDGGVEGGGGVRQTLHALHLHLGQFSSGSLSHHQ